MRHHLIRIALGAIVLCSPLRAQGLVELSLSGEITTKGGARVEIEVKTLDPNKPDVPAVTSLAVMLAERTSAADLGMLLAKRLETTSFVRVIWRGEGAPTHGPVNLFLDGVLGVGLRLGNGIEGRLTLCEDRPASVKLTPGLERRQGGEFRVVALTREDKSREMGRIGFVVKLDERSEITDVGTRLVHAAIGQGWPSELKGHDTWCPGPMTETQRVLSASLELDAAADWRLDVALAPRVQR